MNNIATSAALDRILALKWDFDKLRFHSYAALIQEYLRRAAIWAKRLDAVDQWPFFDIAGYVAPRVSVPESTINRLSAALEPFSLWPTVRKTCEWYLRWASAESRQPKKIANFGLPQPYEPLLRFYERGGRFRTEHGFINVDMAGIPAEVTGLQRYECKAPLMSMDEPTLNDIDSRWIHS